MNAPRAVLFDFSATLFDPTGVVDGPALAASARRHGRHVDRAVAGRLAGRILAHADSPGGRRTRAGADCDAGRHRTAWLRIAAAVPGVDSLVARAFYDCVTDPARWRPYADTAAVLAAVKGAGMQVAVVSNCGWDLRAAFVRHDLTDFVDAYVLSYEHGREKPDPALFRLACGRLRVPAEAALMVGDDPQTDGGAVAVGIATYLLPAAVPGRRDRGLASAVGGLTACR